VAGLIAATSGA